MDKKEILNLKRTADNLFDIYLDAYNDGQHERILHDAAINAFDAYNVVLKAVISELKNKKDR